MKKMKLLPLLTNKYNVFLFLKALLLIALLSLMSCSKRKIKEVFGAFSFSALEITVPEGFFVMGSRAGNPDERPERNIYISTFLIDTTEGASNPSNACCDMKPANNQVQPILPINKHY